MCCIELPVSSSNHGRIEVQNVAMVRASTLSTCEMLRRLSDECVLYVQCMCAHGMSVLTGDEGTGGAGIPRHVTRQSRLLEERDGTSDTRDRTDVRRQVGHNEE